MSCNIIIVVVIVVWVADGGACVFRIVYLLYQSKWANKYLHTHMHAYIQHKENLAHTKIYVYKARATSAFNDLAEGSECDCDASINHQTYGNEFAVFMYTSVHMCVCVYVYVSCFVCMVRFCYWIAITDIATKFASIYTNTQQHTYIYICMYMVVPLFTSHAYVLTCFSASYLWRALSRSPKCLKIPYDFCIHALRRNIVDAAHTSDVNIWCCQERFVFSPMQKYITSHINVLYIK